MSAHPLPEELIAELQNLTDEQLNALREVIREIEYSRRPPYDPDNDPTIGLISGPTDLAARAKDILRAEFGLHRSADYDRAKDPMIMGLFSGPPDLAERSEEILRAEFGLKQDDETEA